MIKRIMALFLALLMLPAAAFGASVREADALETEVGSGAVTLLDVVCSAAMIRAVPSLTADEMPSQSLTEGVLGVYTYAETGAEEAVFTRDEAAQLYSMFFAAGTYDMPDSSDCPCVTIENGEMKMDLEELNETPLAGVWVYESRLLEDGRLYVKGDVYTAWGYVFVSAWDVPDEDLTWYCPVEACLEINADALYGYRLVSYSMGEIYLDGNVSKWREFADEAEGYSLLMPSVLGLSGESEGLREWQTGDGEVTFRILVLPAMNESEADNHLEGEPGLVKDMRLGSDMIYYTVSGPEKAQFLFAGEGLNHAYMVTLTYPESRRDEMTLYLEFIRNSFSEEGSVNG